MGVHGGVFTIKFYGFLAAGHTAKDIRLAATIDDALALRNLDELRLPLEIVEKKHSRKFRQMEAGGDLRKVGRAVGVFFLVDEGGIGDRWSGGAIFLVILRGRPIYE